MDLLWGDHARLQCRIGDFDLIHRLHGDPTWGGPEMVVVPLALTLLAAALTWLTRPYRAG
jgi:hypothetical protein